jgi:hypothetical protein
LWIGAAARIRAAEVRKEKTDARDAALLLELWSMGKFGEYALDNPGIENGALWFGRMGKLAAISSDV